MNKILDRIKTLYADAEKKTDAALASEDVEAIKALNKEATELREQADALVQAYQLKAYLREPQLPAPLPVGGDGTQPTPEDDKTPGPAIKAAYTLRFGDEDDAIQQILIDLHGANYMQQRWEHTKSFNRWLRDYTNPLIPPEGRKFLWTPDTVKVAMKEGQDVTAMKTVMVEAAGQLGGYITPEDWRANVVSRLAADSIIRQRATVVTTSRDVYEQPKCTGGDAQYTSAVRVTWVDETPEAGVAATNLTWGMERIPVHTVMAETFFSRSQVEDAAFNLPAYLGDKLAEAATIDEDNQFLVGDGQGKPYGILPGNLNALGLAEELSGASGTVAWDGLIALYYAVPARYRSRAVWVAQNATYAAIAKLKAATTGEYLWREMYGMHAISTARPTPLMGKEALEQEVMSALTGNSYSILFGDISGYTIVDRVGMSIERYLDSQTARQDMVCYLMRRRLGGKVMEPWRLAVQKTTA